MTPQGWNELRETLAHVVLGCLLILLFAWGLVEVMQ